MKLLGEVIYSPLQELMNEKRLMIGVFVERVHNLPFPVINILLIQHSPASEARFI
jgi:hypothetical protein